MKEIEAQVEEVSRDLEFWGCLRKFGEGYFSLAPYPTKEEAMKYAGKETVRMVKITIPNPDFQ